MTSTLRRKYHLHVPVSWYAASCGKWTQVEWLQDGAIIWYDAHTGPVVRITFGMSTAMTSYAHGFAISGSVQVDVH